MSSACCFYPDPLQINEGACCSLGSAILDSCGGVVALGDVLADWGELTNGY